MANEEGFNPEKEVDEALEKAGEPVLSEDDVEKAAESEAQTAESQQTEDPAGDTEAIDSAIKEADKATEEDAPKSFLVSPTSEDEEGEQIPDKEVHTGRYVPVEDHAKLRKQRQTETDRADAAEAELEKVKSSQSGTGTAPEKTGEEKTILDDLEDDDVVTVGEAKGEIGKIVQQALAKVQTANQTKADKAAQTKKVEQLLLAAEGTARKAYTDYDDVCAKAFEQGVITKPDYEAIMSAKNPAAALYVLCKQKTGVIGGSPSADSTNKEETGDETDEHNEDEMNVEDDTKFMDDVFANQAFE